MNSGRAGRAAGAPLALGVRLAVLVLLLCSCGPPVATGQAESLDIEQIAQRDLYAVLELEPGAAAFDVKAAYRKLAKKWHPDKNPDDTQTAQSKFAEIAEAYEVLSDDSSRQLYDHARRVRAAHEHANSDHNREHSGGRGRGGGGGGAGVWEMDPEWFYADGGDWDGFGSSFGGGAAFGGAPYGGGWGGAGGGGAFEFRARDPMELFETKASRIRVPASRVRWLLAVA
ncbi:Heat shock protein 40 like protein/ DnaJ domain containing protein [Ectocarpus siliculosus]|uniref:Heat shock protein 40 like protein/ DnaJ domain containing protein n=1 Tax=Ectocarpus siliculosus TaxID=2880 RepID=D7FV19_ECTSI|nr:Heat shock protein 40 like protein/ DnaJ domain containing protein [Ectocarpus siliculosus]|eukprot:CBJ31825.1 Heat shock protein 40 like protein/ DnaJ domain containing protein [Ectocarpus siliculosus]